MRDDYVECAEDGPEVWGGIECTHVRVGDGYRDQMTENGHRTRRGDL